MKRCTFILGYYAAYFAIVWKADAVEERRRRLGLAYFMVNNLVANTLKPFVFIVFYLLLI